MSDFELLESRRCSNTQDLSAVIPSRIVGWLCLDRNLKRAELNMKCRELLSAHIRIVYYRFSTDPFDMIQDSRLGIKVEPSQMRLKPTPDPYTWERIEKKEHLFSKNISDHSTGALKELCEGISTSFAAIGKSSTRDMQAKSVQETVSALISLR